MDAAARDEHLESFSGMGRSWGGGSKRREVRVVDQSSLSNQSPQQTQQVMKSSKFQPRLSDH